MNYIPDDGFTEKVLSRLPARKDPWRVSRWVGGATLAATGAWSFFFRGLLIAWAREWAHGGSTPALIAVGAAAALMMVVVGVSAAENA